jgi:hypothetical protein
MPLLTLCRSARAQPSATTKLVVMAQHPTVRRGCEVVAHAHAGARQLHNVWLALFILVCGVAFLPEDRSSKGNI